jgi:hypothetical protein
MLANLHMNPGEIASFFTNNIIVHVSAFLPVAFTEEYITYN